MQIAPDVATDTAQPSIYDYVVAQLNGPWKGRWPKLSKDTEIPYGTIKKIADGQTANPGVLTVEKLAQHFRSQAAA